MDRLSFKNRTEVFQSFAVLCVSCVVTSFVGSYLLSGVTIGGIADPFSRYTGIEIIPHFLVALLILAMLVWLTFPFGFVDLFVNLDKLELTHETLASFISVSIVPVYWIIVVVIAILILKRKSKIWFGVISVISHMGAIKSIIIAMTVVNAV